MFLLQIQMFVNCISIYLRFSYAVISIYLRAVSQKRQNSKQEHFLLQRRLSYQNIDFSNGCPDGTPGGGVFRDFHCFLMPESHGLCSY